ncbi:Sugar transporter [Musa troglodytarum]|uniref:Sugar transporter n=1 Tax=Musa troglodytarum TaxID=320322 RepID=A0A9E7JFC2_9LILI|nr:Sugar transporter [Musa troglodytarum]
MAVASFAPSKSLCRSHSPSSSRPSPPSMSSSIGFSDGRRGSWARIVSGGLDLTGRSHAPAEMLVGSTSKEAWSGIDGWRRRRRGGVGAIMCSADAIGSGLEIEQPQGLAAIPERAKVLALVALVCNADRVVMSVAVVPLASQHGWSSSFVGIVQAK